jgi:hypothetical protein
MPSVFTKAALGIASATCVYGAVKVGCGHAAAAARLTSCVSQVYFYRKRHLQRKEELEAVLIVILKIAIVMMVVVVVVVAAAVVLVLVNIIRAPSPYNPAPLRRALSYKKKKKTNPRPVVKL